MNNGFVPCYIPSTLLGTAAPVDVFLGTGLVTGRCEMDALGLSSCVNGVTLAPIFFSNNSDFY